MYNLVAGLSGFLKFGSTETDNWVFRLHYKFTVMALIAFSIVVSTNQFFGDPIDCVTSGSEIPQNVIDNYCWVHSTYTLPSAYNKAVGVDVPHPGIDKTTPGDAKEYHAYYQWVCFFLFFQAIFFYIPRWIWRISEGKKVEMLKMQLGKPFMGREVNETSVQSVMTQKQRVHNYCDLLAGYLVGTRGNHGLYAYIYYLCEVLNFANVVGQIYFANAFLGGEFTTYGTEVIKFTMENEVERTDPMIKVFPRITKCTFRRFGPSGDIQNHDSMCILPINMLNEKIFIFLWFYYIILSIVSGLVVVYHLLFVAIPFLRVWVINKGLKNDTDNDDDPDNNDPRVTIKDFLKSSNLSDWMILKLLKQNVNPVHFNELVKSIDTKMEEEKNKKKKGRKIEDGDESKQTFLSV